MKECGGPEHGVNVGWGCLSTLVLQAPLPIAPASERPHPGPRPCSVTLSEAAGIMNVDVLKRYGTPAF